MAGKMGFAVRARAGGDVTEVDIMDDISSYGWPYGISAQDVIDQVQSSNAKTIKLRINSVGGDVFEGMAIYNVLKAHPAQVEAEIISLAASITSVIAMAANKIVMHKNAMMMIHRSWGGAMGNTTQMAGMAELLGKIDDQMADVYTARTGQQRDSVMSMMDKETWMTADEAKALGFADAVLPNQNASSKAMASLNLSGFKGTPQVFAKAVEHAQRIVNGPVPYREYDLNDTSSWDGPAAEMRVRKWASSDGSGDASTMDWAKYRKAFTWYDDANPEAFGSYKLPHHDIVNGDFVTVKSGVIAAGNAVAGSRGGVDIPENDLAGVKSHLEKHYHEWDAKAPWETPNDSAGTQPANSEPVLAAVPTLALVAREPTTTTRNIMDELEELKAKNPKLYAQILALGVKEERERVQAHLAAFEISGDIALVTASIADGSQLTPALQMKHLKAGQTRTDIAARQDDSNAAGAVVAGSPAVRPQPNAGAAKDMGDLIMALEKGATANG